MGKGPGETLLASGTHSWRLTAQAPRPTPHRRCGSGGSVPGQVRLPGSGGGLPGSRWAGSHRRGSSSHSERSSQQSPRYLGDETCLEKWGLSALAPSLHCSSHLTGSGTSSPCRTLGQAGPGGLRGSTGARSHGVRSWWDAPAHRDSCSTSVRKLCFTVVHSRSASCSPQGKWRGAA